MDTGTAAYLAFLALILGYVGGRLHANMDAEQRRLSSDVSSLKFAVADAARRQGAEARDG